MSAELAQRIAALATTMDAARLGDLVSLLRKEAPDARAARRLIERHTSGRAAGELRAVFADGDVAAVVDALDAARLAATSTRRELGNSGMVWSGPATRGVSSRSTRAVVSELIGRADTSLTLVTYAGHDIADLVKELDQARLERHVEVRIILETKDDAPHESGPDPSPAFKHLPLAVPVYRWPREQRGPKGGSMHVKCVVRDRCEVLITSANLTSAALDRNMELGAVLEGGPVAAVVERHFDDLIDARVLVPVEKAAPWSTH